MKTTFFSCLLFFMIIFSSVSFAQRTFAANKEPSYFTTTDQSNWVYVLKDTTIEPVSVFKMDKGILKITGISSGYLRTRKVYQEFELNVEWRWTETPGNSGVLVYIQPKDTIWPVCYQVQQKVGDAGDIICMNGLWAKECTDSLKFTVKKMLASNEKPVGEWNNMKVICINRTLRVFVNGMLQNNITGLTAATGFIGFQNEGKPLEFRNLSIINLNRKNNDKRSNF